MASYFHKKCNRTIKKFYEDFDLLPLELKEIIWKQPHPPTFEDLKAAWQLADEMGYHDDVHVLRKDRKVQKAKDLKAARLAKRAEANNRRWLNRLGKGQYRNLYQKVPLEERNDKHSRLIRLLPEQAMEVMAGRERADDVKEVLDYKYVRVGRVKVTDDATEATEYFEGNRPPQLLSKMMDNARGRKGPSDIEQLATVSKKHRG